MTVEVQIIKDLLNALKILDKHGLIDKSIFKGYNAIAENAENYLKEKELSEAN